MAKILIIDDEKDTCDYLKDFFEIRGCIVFTSSSGESGLEILKKENPSIVLLDIKMSGIDGLETLNRIKAYNKNIKVIMITVAADDATREQAGRLGADDFIKKPFNIRHLEGVVCLQL